MIVAIGGSASVGKTTLAAALQDRIGPMEVVHVDDLLPEAGPNFIDRMPDVWQRPPGWLCDQLIEWTAQLHPFIHREVARLQDVGHGVVEGEGIEPRMTTGWDPDVVRAVYVIESDPAVLCRTFTGRSSASRFLALTPRERTAVVEMNRRYGHWLQDTANEAGQVWIPSQSWSTLVDRTVAALGLATRT